jgi:hypothetical protein
MGRSEQAILHDTLLEVSALPETLVYRQNTGQAWTGRPVDKRVGEYIKVEPGMKILAEARPIQFGVPGSGDIVGTSRGRPLQIETKTLTGKQREIQGNFQRQWVRCGGLYLLVRDPKEAVKALL